MSSLRRQTWRSGGAALDPIHLVKIGGGVLPDRCSHRCSQCEHSSWALLLKHLLRLIPVRKEKYFKQAVSVILRTPASAAVATLSRCVSGRGRKVVDIVLLLLQQHNKKIFTSFLTRRTRRRVVANFWKFLLLLPFVLSTFFCPCCSVFTAPL